MFANFQFAIYLSVFSVAIYWLFSSTSVKARCWLIILTSFSLFASVSLVSIFWLIAMTFLALCIIYLQSKFVVCRTIPFSLIIFVPLVAYSALETNESYALVAIGLSYYTLKLYSLIRDAANLSAELSITDVLFYVTFYPVFTVGPIENFNSLNSKKLATEFDSNQFLYGLYRVLVGFFKVNYLGAALITPLITGFEYTSADQFSIWLWTFLSLLFLYVNFSGFSDIAIGLSRLYGIEVRENFNHPYLAKNIQEFWQRWHMSLGAWVNQYLYFPLVRSNGRPLISIFAVFLLIGAWHKFTLTYFLWGAFHGGAMALNNLIPKWFKANIIYQKGKDTKIYGALTCILTLVYVAVISRFANFPTLDIGLDYLASLL